MKIYDYNGKANVIGPLIKEARIRQNLTQEELAIRMQLKCIEMSQKTISRIEKQERFVTDFELLIFLKVLNLDINQLISL